ncbi:MAG: hypothetical protein KGZ25_01515, partial [Planctomycetes bacterium]|nr:hypothetical protein [Planctomycetota bacterium]
MKLDEISLLPQDESLISRISREHLSFSPEQVWSPSPSVDHRTTPYPVPKTLRQGLRVTVETGAKFSPPPFAAIVDGNDHRVLIGVEADAGWHLWNFIDFTVMEKGAEVRIDLEGHSDPVEVAEHVRVVLARSSKEEPRMDLLARTMRELYPEGTTTHEQVPDWWLRPIYCGWADQVALAKYENGARAGGGGRYCTREFYERWIERLEEAELPIGTVILDAGWATGVWEPDPEKWPDLKGFIASQHNAGRKVLLWIGTWVCGGVPAELCVMAGNRKICVDPTNPQYRSLIQERIEELLSPEGYDADGFKIDQLGRPPSERPAKSPKYAHLPAYHEEQDDLLQIHGDCWGCELLYLHQA